MPLIAYQRAHGSTDYPHHYAFFTEMENRGVLDRADFAIDPFMDPEYARRLTLRFPQLVLATDRHWSRKAIEWLKRYVGKGYRWVAMLDRSIDAVCEAPGGRLTTMYSGNLSNWWLYPKARRKAVLFHSLESGVLGIPRLKQSLGEADIFVARTSKSAENARATGCKQVVEASDIVFNYGPHSPPVDRSGIAVALRVPNIKPTEKYLNSVRSVLDHIDSRSDQQWDLVRIEEPIGSEMYSRDYVSGRHPHIRLFAEDVMYYPFMARRDAIVSCRLHTTVIALLHGNRKILQAQIESGTSKLQQFREDLGLSSLSMHGGDDIGVQLIEEFLGSDKAIPEEEAIGAINRAKAKNEKGLDAVEEWINSLK